MITALCIIGYIILMLFTAWALYHWGNVGDKADSLGLGVIWPCVLLYLLAALLLLPFWWIGQQIIKLWDKFED